MMLFQIPIPLPQKAAVLPSVAPARPSLQSPEQSVSFSSEPLAFVPDDLPGLRCVPQYKMQGVAGAIGDCWVRETVLNKLLLAADSLAAYNRTLVIWDAWRPVAVQQALYDDYQAQLRRSYPHLSPSELDALAREFVALPSLDPLCPSPHFTGGAVDVTLADEEGRELPLGTPYDDFSPCAYTRYFEELEQERPLSEAETACRDNRRLLYHTLIAQGFTNYEAEWWHFDYGNRLWAGITGMEVVYGPAQPQQRNGELNGENI